MRGESEVTCDLTFLGGREESADQTSKKGEGRLLSTREPFHRERV
jgi:hypothetical protein